MKFTEQFLQQIRDALSVSEVVGRRVELKRKGAEYVGLSPFQKENSPSFTVNDEKGFFHCFSSGEHGDIFDFMVKVESLNFRDAVEECANRAGIPMPHEYRSNERRPATPPKDDLPPHIDDAPPFDPDQYDLPPRNEKPAKPKSEITKTYDYMSSSGDLLYQVCRLEWYEGEKRKKTFLQRRPTGDGHWIWGLGEGIYIQSRKGDWFQKTKDREKWEGAARRKFDAVPHSLYGLVELKEETAQGSTIILPEGEKDVETWKAWGQIATTNSGGVHNWRDDHAELFRGMHVVIPIDNDKAGRIRADKIGKSLRKHGVLSICLIDFRNVWKDCPEKADTTDWKEAFADKFSGEKAAQHLLEHAEPWVPLPLESKFGGIPFEALDAPGPEHEDIIDGWFSVGARSVLGGASQSGKSFFAIHTGMCVATGMKWFGHDILRPGLVIYQAGEGGTGIRKRFRAWRQYFGIPKDMGRVPIYILQSKVDIHSAEGDTAKLIDEVKAISDHYGMPVRMLFIDTLAKASGAADENSGRDMGIVLSNIDKVADALPGANVCLVHHMNAGGTKLRGHTSVYANSDQVVLVSMDEETHIRTASLDKQKDGENGLKIPFELMSIETGRRYDGKPITSCVTLSAGEKAEIRARTGKGHASIGLSQGQKLIFDSLKRAVEDNGIDTPLELKLPKAIRKVCTWKDWKAAYMAVTSDVTENAVNQAMRRASDKFLNLRIIGRINPYVWVTDRASTVSMVADPMEGDTSAGPPTQAEFDDDLDFSKR